MANLFELSQDLTDQALDQLDKLLTESMRKGERRQEKHFRVNACTLNSHLAVLTKAAEAFLQARADGGDLVAAVLAKVSESHLQATVASAKGLLRPENLDSLDLIETRYTPLRQSLLALYQALNFQPVRKSEPALQTLDYVAHLAERRKHFGIGRGTNIYAHAADIWMPFGKPQVIGTNEEALYVIDALCNHESDLHLREHYTDTAGSTEQVFALTSLLGIRFAPRISDALSKKLYVASLLLASVLLFAYTKGFYAHPPLNGVLPVALQTPLFAYLMLKGVNVVCSGKIS